MSASAPALPPPGTLVEVAPGLRRSSMPLLSGRPSHVNCWLIEDGAGWLLVDTGRGDAPTRELWRSIFATGLDGRPITRVLVTHFHPDHVGLAGWICAEWNAPLLMPRTEWQRTRLLLLDDDAALTAMIVDLLRRAGAEDGHLRWAAAAGVTYRQAVVPPPAQFRPIAEGETLHIGGRAWQVRIGAGHAPEMACLHNPATGILISADHILPRISPHIGIQPSEPEADPLGTYLAALTRFAALPRETLVLPSHGEPFEGLHARIEALQTHHRDSLQRLLEGCDTGRSAAELATLLFRRNLEGRQRSFALFETLAHLRHLEAIGQVGRELDADGAWRFRQKPAL